MKNTAIILVRPQMGENIGATARVMKNFGFSDLRIISPRDGWPNQKAHDMAAHASDIIDNAKIFDSVETAIADTNLVYATASKSRDMEKPIITPRQAAEKINSLNALPASTYKTAILFGRESSGLDNESISHAHALISIPVSPEYDSLNLAQAVCVMCYEIFQDSSISNIEPEAEKQLPNRADINEMVRFLDEELQRKNFFQVPDKKPGMMINIRNIFTRHHYTEQEVRTLRGIFNALKK